LNNEEQKQEFLGTEVIIVIHNQAEETDEHPAKYSVLKDMDNPGADRSQTGSGCTKTKCLHQQHAQCFLLIDFMNNY
jgi:hypothetical protein